MILDAFHERKHEVTGALAELGEVATLLGARSLRERIDRDLVRKLEQDRFHLVVVGEFNHGKSSFVNALLGESALPVGVTPTTATIHHLRYAETPEATIVYTGGRREPLPFDQVKTFAVGGGAASEEVDFLEIGYPAPLLQERILLVDTPGVNDLSLQRADITYSYVPRADAVLFLLDAGQILKESERLFLEEKLLKGSRDKIVFVITKWDLLDEGERKEALAYARAKLSDLVKDPVVFPLSSEVALAGRRGESGFPELLAHLTGFLAEERGRILLANALGEGLAVGALLEKGVFAKRRSLTMHADELARRIQALEADLAGQAGTIEQRRLKLREEIAGIKVGARKDLDRFVADTIRQLPNVIDAAKPAELKQYLPAFLEDAFRKWADAESKEITSSLETLAEKTIAMVREDSQAAMGRLEDALGTDVKRLEVKVDTFGYDVGIFALFTVGLGVMFANVLLGGLLALAAPVLAVVVKDRVDGEYRKRAKELAPEVLRAAAAKAGPKIDEMIDEFAQRLETYVVTAGEELHREVLEVLHATRAGKAEGRVDDALLARQTEEQAARVEAVIARIEGLKVALSTPAVPTSAGATTAGAATANAA